MMEPDKNLERIFEHVVQIANEKDHEYITLEHFLYSMLCNDSFAEILKSFGTDVEKLKHDVDSYITNDLTDIVNSEVEKPKKTNAVDRMLNRAFAQVLFSGRTVIEPTDCFISLLQEKTSHAFYFIGKA